MMSNKDFAIKVDGVSKSFKLPHEKQSSIKGALINFKKSGYETQTVLKDIDFEIKKSDFFGIVGRNGSGKSTLLKMLAGIYAPDKGQVHVRGKLTPFIELGVGFNPELTGRENVYLNGALLGFNRKDMDAMYDEIVSFAEIKRFMDQKLKNYSSGMQVRLAFSIAVKAKSEIMVFDEVLAVGDASFQQKCFDVFAQMKDEGRTIVLVTHDMSSVLRFCTKAMLISDGEIQLIGSPKQVADKYLELNFDNTNESFSTDNQLKGVENKKLKVSKVDIDGRSSGASLTTNDQVVIGVSYSNPEKEMIHFGVQIFNEAGNYCYGTNTKLSGVRPVSQEKGRAELLLDLALLPGSYSLTVAIINESGMKAIVYKPSAYTFRIAKTVETEGIANLKSNWKV